jgi:hypothetical protein
MGLAGRFDGTTRWPVERGLSGLKLSGTYAMPDFGGERSNLADLSLVSDWTIRSWLRSRASYRYLNRNLAQDPERGLLRSEQLWSSDWHWTLAQPWRLELGYRLHLMHDGDQQELVPTQVRQLGLQYRNGPWYWQSRIQQASSSGLKHPTQRLSGSLSGQYRASAQWFFRGDLRASQHTSNGRAELLNEQRNLTLQARWLPNANWSHRVLFRTGVTEGPGIDHQSRHSWRVASQFRWQNQQVLGVQLNHQHDDARAAETAMVLFYQVQVSPALRFRESVGSLYGQVLLRDDNQAVPVANALVRVADQVVRTDEMGHYEIRSLPPQDHAVRVTLPDHALDAPIASHSRIATVVAGKRSHWPILIEPTGRVAGHIKVSSYTLEGLGSWLLEPIDLAGIQWVLTQGEERYLMQANSSGEFQFSGLSSGLWHVRVVGRSLPKYLSVEPLAKTIEVQPGQNRQITFQLRRVPRSFEWLDPGKTYWQID